MSQKIANLFAARSMSAAPEPQPQLPRARKRSPKASAIFDFGYFDMAQHRFWIFDCRNKKSQTELEISCAFFSLIENRQSKNPKFLAPLVDPRSRQIVVQIS